MIEQSTIQNHIPQTMKHLNQSVDSAADQNSSHNSRSANQQQGSPTLQNNILQVRKNDSANNIFPQKRSNQQQSLSGKPPCINRICPKFKNANKLFQNKTYPFKVEDLCSECETQYKKDSYCVYCKQIYFDSSDDGKEWILCEQCGRWVHSECANYDSTNDQQQYFVCLICKKGHSSVLSNSSNIGPSQGKKVITKGSANGATVRQINERRKNPTECSLNAFGFYWQLGPSELAEDMDKIREYLK